MLQVYLYYVYEANCYCKGQSEAELQIPIKVIINWLSDYYQTPFILDTPNDYIIFSSLWGTYFPIFYTSSGYCYALFNKFSTWFHPRSPIWVMVKILSASQQRHLTKRGPWGDGQGFIVVSLKLMIIHFSKTFITLNGWFWTSFTIAEQKLPLRRISWSAPGWWSFWPTADLNTVNWWLCDKHSPPLKTGFI